MARQKGYIGLAMLLRHLAPLHFSVRTTRMGLIERLLYRDVAPGRYEDDVHVSFADRSDTAAILFTAVHCNNVAFVRRLLSRGVDPNVASTVRHCYPESIECRWTLGMCEMLIRRMT